MSGRPRRRVDPAPIRAVLEQAGADPGAAVRSARVVAEWTEGDHSVVTMGDRTLEIAPPRTLDPMQLVLAALGGCLVDTLTTRAALAGVDLERVTVDVSGDFDLRRYLGLADAPGSGYGTITCDVRIVARGASAEQIAALRAAAHASPVGDTLQRGVRLETRVEVDAN